jgi:hypothetical protein
VKSFLNISDLLAHAGSAHTLSPIGRKFGHSRCVGEGARGAVVDPCLRSES